MPKLKSRDIERNQRRIEAAALRVFTRQGYHGTSVREIAAAAGVSIGNLYNYYRTKEQLFASVVKHYEARMAVLQAQTLGGLQDPFDGHELRRLAGAVRRIVYGNPDYWRLMYIDVIEFRSKHFAPAFRSLSRVLSLRLRDRLQRSTRRGPWRGIDPALAFTAIYLQLFTYFLIEKLFGGKHHLGMPEERAIAQLIRMASEGLWREEGARAAHAGL